MRPFDVKLDYRGRPWCTVKFELGHNEIGDADEPEYFLAPDLAGLFIEVGLEAPQPLPVLRADHQVAQKLHAVSGEGSERARDLVDLQLLDQGGELDLVQVAATCQRLFDFDSNSPGRQPSSQAISGTPSTPRPPTDSTYFRLSERQSRGARVSLRGSSRLRP